MTSLSLKDRLKRMIYLNKINPQFYVGNPDQYQRDMSELRQSTLEAAVQDDFKELFAVIDAANKDNHLPRRSIIFMVLGRLMHHKAITPELKSKITAKVLEVIQDEEDFFNFIKYYTQARAKTKMPSSVEKLVRQYYKKKTPLELAQCVSKTNKMNKWSHKDLIKLSHFRSDTPLKNIVINYILTRKISDRASEEEVQLVDIIKKSDELRKTKEPIEAVPIITALKFTMDQVSSSLQLSGEVWDAAIQNMSIQQILPCLCKLYKLGLLKVNTPISNYVVDLFTSPEKVKTSGVHPIEVFSHMKKLEKGGKPMDMKLLHHLQNEKKLSEAHLKKAQTRTEAKSPHILNALLKCFDLACGNVASTNKRYLITIDVTSDAKKAACIGNKVLTFLEAAVAYAIVLLRAQKDVVVATYNDDTIQLLEVEKKVTFTDLYEEVMRRTATYSQLYSAVEWAASEKRHVDVFINFIHNEYLSKIPKDKVVSKSKFEPIVKYRSKVNLPNSKSITFAPVKRLLPLWADVPPNVLGIFGFDTTACKVAECFARGAFC